jgi:hypothetical protein
MTRGALGAGAATDGVGLLLKPPDEDGLGLDRGAENPPDDDGDDDLLLELLLLDDELLVLPAQAVPSSAKMVTRGNPQRLIRLMTPSLLRSTRLCSWRVSVWLMASRKRRP